MFESDFEMVKIFFAIFKITLELFYLFKINFNSIKITF